MVTRSLTIYLSLSFSSRRSFETETRAQDVLQTLTQGHHNRIYTVPIPRSTCILFISYHATNLAYVYE